MFSTRRHDTTDRPRERRHSDPDAVAVIGLGRFGSALALELIRNGAEVLGIDDSESTVQELNGRLTTVARADATREEALRQLGVDEFDKVVVGIGTDIQASILVASRLLKFGRPEIWAKAITEPHAEILDQLGVHHVIRPEHDMGVRAAHLIRGRVLDFAQIDEGFALVRCTVPEQVQQRPLDTLGLRTRYGVSIVAVRRPGESWAPTEPSTVLYEDDQVLVTGPTDKAEAFSNRT
ncbi:potassium channel family protein [Kocuria sp. CPCC 205300]|uniref:potassium channel family protein n=1 Tax=Kocuria sabuli TaxID=3071448 RepID=UPI0036DA7E2D